MTRAPFMRDSPQIQYASKAKHPNIVALLDVFVELERLVIVVRLFVDNYLLGSNFRKSV